MTAVPEDLSYLQSFEKYVQYVSELLPLKKLMPWIAGVRSAGNGGDHRLMNRVQHFAPSYPTFEQSDMEHHSKYCWHYLFIWQVVLRGIKHIAVTGWTRQCVNWWLGYILSQPVDIDLGVLVYFARNYVGLNVFQLVNKSSEDSIPTSFSHETESPL